MTNQQHPITPPSELVQQWVTEAWNEGTPAKFSLSAVHIATESARWGADQELEACCEWLGELDLVGQDFCGRNLRAARRPKAPNLKEEALAAQQRMWNGTSNHDDWNLVRRALEALDD